MIGKSKLSTDVAVSSSAHDITRVCHFVSHEIVIPPNSDRALTQSAAIIFM